MNGPRPCLRNGQAVGYALIDGHGVPNVNTVSSTERGAMVAALIIVWGEAVHPACSDVLLAKFFNNRKPWDHKIGPVMVERLLDAQAVRALAGGD